MNSFDNSLDLELITNAPVLQNKIINNILKKRICYYIPNHNRGSNVYPNSKIN